MKLSKVKVRKYSWDQKVENVLTKRELECLKPYIIHAINEANRTSRYQIDPEQLKIKKKSYDFHVLKIADATHMFRIQHQDVKCLREATQNSLKFSKSLNEMRVDFVPKKGAIPDFPAALVILHKKYPQVHYQRPPRIIKKHPPEFPHFLKKISFALAVIGMVFSIPIILFSRR